MIQMHSVSAVMRAQERTLLQLVEDWQRSIRVEHLTLEPVYERDVCSEQYVQLMTNVMAEIV